MEAIVRGSRSRHALSRPSILIRLASENIRAIVKELLRHKHESTSEIYVKFDELQSDRLIRARIVNDGCFDDPTQEHSE